MPSAEEGEKRLERLARFLERDHESAARSLREGMAEMFTLQQLKLPPSLYKCLATTNGDRKPAGRCRAPHLQRHALADADVVERWVASAWLLTETHFRKIDGHRDAMGPCHHPRPPGPNPNLQGGRSVG